MKLPKGTFIARGVLCAITLSLFSAVAQNLRYDSVALGPRGPIAGATVAICTQPATTSTQPCSPLANLCSSLSDVVCTQPNPLTADSLGNYHFYAKTSQTPFTVQIYGPQVAAPVVFVDQGVSGTITLGAVISPSNVDNIIYVDGTKYPTLASAVAACSGNPCKIYDSFPETTSANPFAGLAQGSEVFLGSGPSGSCNFSTSAQWIIPNKVRVHMYGRNCGLQAISGFPAATPLIQLGPTSGLAFGVSIDGGTLNCNNFANIGIYSNSINEESGAWFLNIINCPTGGVQMEGTGVGQAVGDYTLHDIEIYPGSTGTASTYAVKLDGFATNSSQPGPMYNITYVGNSGAVSTAGYIFEGLTGGFITSLHCEQATTCYQIGDGTAAVTGGVFTRLESGPGVANTVSLGNAATANVVLLDVDNLSAATHTVNNAINSTFVNDTNVPMYAWGGKTYFTNSFLIEGTAPAAVANYDACYADSTAHAIKCSYNNGSYFNVPQVIGSGTAAMTTAAITAGNCGTTVTVSATGVATTDTITWAFNAAPAGSNAGIVAWPTANNVNFAYCSNTAQTPAAATINWRVVR